MANRVSVTAADGHSFEAWRADPAGSPKGGVIFLQAIYGLTSHLGDVCDQFAATGFAAMAPALYDRIEPNTVFPYDHDGMLGGMAFRENLTEATVLADVSACADALRPAAGKIAISGFCTGGTWAFISASELDLDAAVIFYGTDVHDHLDRTLNCPTLMHYGDVDHILPIETIRKIEATYPEAEFHVYPGAGHAFYNPEQANHHADAASLAHDRSVEFLNRQFGDT
jgi:carboxymethylenebutenolidase